LEEEKILPPFGMDISFWTDRVTVEDYLSSHGGLLTGTISRWQELREVEIGRDVHLERVVLWDGASVPDGNRLKDALVIQ
jgi:hypothetical protein